jgi:hypothetical protein
MKILVAGDSYCPTRVFGEPFRILSREHAVTQFDLVDEPAWPRPRRRSASSRSTWAARAS